MPAIADMADDSAPGPACPIAIVAADSSPAPAERAAAAPPAQPLPWSIPAVWGPTADAVPDALTASEDLAGGARAETLPSTLWTPETVARLSSGLVRDRNRFVCMQLATMASEQLSKVAAARAAGDAAALRAAGSVFLSTLEAGGHVVGGALHYPRAASKAAAAAVAEPAGKPEPAGKAASGGCGGGVFPHMYVELICINEPGKGYGSLLLQHGEDWRALLVGARAWCTLGPSTREGTGRKCWAHGSPCAAARQPCTASRAPPALEPPADPPLSATSSPNAPRSRGLCPHQRPCAAPCGPRRRCGRRRRAGAGALLARLRQLPARHQAALCRVCQKVLRRKRIFGARRMQGDVQSTRQRPPQPAARRLGEQLAAGAARTGPCAVTLRRAPLRPLAGRWWAGHAAASRTRCTLTAAGDAH